MTAHSSNESAVMQGKNRSLNSKFDHFRTCDDQDISSDPLSQSNRCFSMIELSNIHLIHELTDEIDSLSDANCSSGESAHGEGKDDDGDDGFFFFEEEKDDPTDRLSSVRSRSITDPENSKPYQNQTSEVVPTYGMKRSISFAGFRENIHTDKLVSTISELAPTPEEDEHDLTASEKSNQNVEQTKKKPEKDLGRKQEHKHCPSLRPAKSSMKKSSDEIYVNKKLMRTYSSKDMRAYLQFNDSASSFNSNSSPSPSKSEPTKIKRNISFSTLEVRVYDVTLGDNPGGSTGPPVSLDWNYENSESIDLEDYESARAPRRTKKDMRMDSRSRHCYLSSRFTSADLITASNEARKIRLQRKKSYVNTNMEPLHEVLQSTERKFKRFLRRNKKDHRNFI